MSWCRWSTDIDNKYNSDLYIYDHVDGHIQVHVAGRRRSNYADNPHPEPSWDNVVEHDQVWIQNFIETSRLRSEWFDANDTWEPVPEPFAGKHYNFDYDNIQDLVEFLTVARSTGINFPDYIFDYAKEYVNDKFNH